MCVKKQKPIGKKASPEIIVTVTQAKQMKVGLAHTLVLANYQDSLAEGRLGKYERIRGDPWFSDGECPRVEARRAFSGQGLSVRASY